MEKLGRKSNIDSLKSNPQTLSKQTAEKEMKKDPPVKATPKVVPQEQDYTSRLLAAKKKTWEKRDEDNK